jgi:hypothetical protein
VKRQYVIRGKYESRDGVPALRRVEPLAVLRTAVLGALIIPDCDIGKGRGLSRRHLIQQRVQKAERITRLRGDIAIQDSHEAAEDRRRAGGPAYGLDRGLLFQHIRSKGGDVGV